jgi:hypothetical protein
VSETEPLPVSETVPLPVSEASVCVPVSGAELVPLWLSVPSVALVWDALSLPDPESVAVDGSSVEDPLRLSESLSS